MYLLNSGRRRRWRGRAGNCVASLELRFRRRCVLHPLAAAPAAARSRHHEKDQMSGTSGVVETMRRGARTEAEREHDGGEHDDMERRRKGERRAARVEQPLAYCRGRPEQCRLTGLRRLTACRDQRTAEADGLGRRKWSVGTCESPHLSRGNHRGTRYLIEGKDVGGRVRSHEDSQSRGKSLAYAVRVFPAKTGCACAQLVTGVLGLSPSTNTRPSRSARVRTMPKPHCSSRALTPPDRTNGDAGTFEISFANPVGTAPPISRRRPPGLSTRATSRATVERSASPNCSSIAPVSSTTAMSNSPSPKGRCVTSPASVSTSTPASAAARFTRAMASSSGVNATARPERPTFAAIAATRAASGTPTNTTRSPSFTPVMLTESMCGSGPRRTNGLSDTLNSVVVISRQSPVISHQ